VLPDLFGNLPAPFLPAFHTVAPWALLGDPLDTVLADQRLIDDTARIHPSAVIEGPVFIGAHAEVRPGAFIRGGSWIGEHAVVGANTEIKRGILFPHAKAPHLNYVGDSILGAAVNLGAGTILSNHRHDRKDVHIEGTGTGRRKLGAILGDGVVTGCGSVLHPGVVVGRGTQIYPGVQLRPGVYPADSIVKLRQALEVVSRV
jgi:bifunctional N-acetylglucosamine-1-phosphate-uridyltransferase/glucosamine-1-phosphate-acetyltransferase GlmU-like protein